MGNVCLVPLNYLYKRGQGIKIFSLISVPSPSQDIEILLRNIFFFESLHCYSLQTLTSALNHSEF